MKIIFFDVDGVLNNEEWFHSPLFQNNKLVMFNGAKYGNEICVELVKNLRDIVDHTGAKLVLSPSWGWYAQWKPMRTYLNHILEMYGMSIMDDTKSEGNKPKEIKMWLDANKKGYNIESFVIIQNGFKYNDFAEYGLGKNLIQTNYRGKNGGLQLSHVTKAIKILENNSGFRY